MTRQDLQHTTLTLALEAWHGRAKNLSAGQQLFSTVPAPTGRRVSHNTQLKWRMPGAAC